MLTSLDLFSKMGGLGVVQCLTYYVDNWVEVSEFVRIQKCGIQVGKGTGSVGKGY